MKNKIVTIIFCLVLVVTLVGCGTSPALPKEPSSIHTSYTSTSGNLTYFELNSKSGNPGKNTEQIDRVISKWEKENPDRSLVSFQVIYQQPAYGAIEEVKGIYIYSKPNSK